MSWFVLIIVALNDYFEQCRGKRQRQTLCSLQDSKKGANTETLPKNFNWKHCARNFPLALSILLDLNHLLPFWLFDPFSCREKILAVITASFTENKQTNKQDFKYWKQDYSLSCKKTEIWDELRQCLLMTVHVCRHIWNSAWDTAMLG